MGERLWEARVENLHRLSETHFKNVPLVKSLELPWLPCVAVTRITLLLKPKRFFIRAIFCWWLDARSVYLRLNKLGISVQPEKHTITTFGMTLIELILAPHSVYVGKTIKEMNFRRKYGFTALAILRRGRSYRTDVGDLPLEPGDSLLVVGPPCRLRDLRVNPDIIIFEPDPATRPVPRRRAVISVLVFAGAVVLALLGLPVYLAVLATALLAILLGLLPIWEAYQSIEWQIIFFIAGMYVASLGMINTGLASLIGRGVIRLVGNAGSARTRRSRIFACSCADTIDGKSSYGFRGRTDRDYRRNSSPYKSTGDCCCVCHWLFRVLSDADGSFG